MHFNISHKKVTNIKMNSIESFKEHRNAYVYSNFQSKYFIFYYGFSLILSLYLY